MASAPSNTRLAMSGGQKWGVVGEEGGREEEGGEEGGAASRVSEPGWQCLGDGGGGGGEGEGQQDCNLSTMGAGGMLWGLGERGRQRRGREGNSMQTLGPMLALFGGTRQEEGEYRPEASVVCRHQALQCLGKGGGGRRVGKTMSRISGPPRHCLMNEDSVD